MKMSWKEKLHEKTLYYYFIVNCVLLRLRFNARNKQNFVGEWQVILFRK